MKKTLIYKPHKLLKPFIDAYIIAYDSKTSVNKNHFYPSNQPILCFDIDKKHFKESGAENDFNFSFGLVGVMDHFIHLDTVPKKSMQIVFKPYGAFQFFKTPMQHFVNNGIDVENMLPDLAECIHKLEDAYHDDQNSIKIIENFLLVKLKSSPDKYDYFDGIQFACETIKNRENPIKISNICHEIGMSETRFRLHFKEKIGISPKKMNQIETFKQIHTYLKKTPHIDWMEIVEKFSFFDQTHFINNFKWFFECTPTEYLKSQRESEIL